MGNEWRISMHQMKKEGKKFVALRVKILFGSSDFNPCMHWVGFGALVVDEWKSRIVKVLLSDGLCGLDLSCEIFDVELNYKVRETCG